MIANNESENSTSKEEEIIDVNENMEELKKKKKEVQIFLLQYENNFANQNRRPVRFAQDREAAKEEYALYHVCPFLLSSFLNWKTFYQFFLFYFQDLKKKINAVEAKSQKQE